MGALLAKHWRAVLVSVVALVLTVYLGPSLVIGWQVKSTVAAAQESEGGDIVQALLAVVRSDDATTRQRNRSVWALGQLGAREALPVLRSFACDTQCDHEARICQYELSKAIEACSGSRNAGALVWRHGDLAVQ